MKYLLRLDLGEVIDGFIGNYLVPRNSSKDAYLKRIFKSLVGKFGYSLEKSIAFLMQMGERHSLKYTFFVVGKLAKANPGLVEHLLKYGHEVASHSMTHLLPVRLAPSEFKNQLQESRAILESQGAEILGFRAPHLLLRDAQYGLLADTGYAYSSSKLWAHPPLSYQTSSGAVTEFPLHYQDWNYHVMKHDIPFVTRTVREALCPGNVLLFHPTFLGSPPFEKIWDTVFAGSTVPRSVPLRDFHREDKKREKALSITIDLGLGRWE
jgi:hypothetical protein